MNIKKTFILFSFFLSINAVKAQIYQHFIFKDHKIGVYDTIKQPIAERAIRDYYLNNLDSSIFYNEKLLMLDSTYYPAYFNVAKVYAAKKDTIHTIENLKKYIHFSDSKCKCSFMNSSVFNFIKDSSLNDEKRICQKAFDDYVTNANISNPKLLEFIDQIVGMEQEILGNMVTRDRSSLLKENFKNFTLKVDTINFPSNKEIGRGIGLVQLIVLHLDYYPAIQLSLGKRLLKQTGKGYESKLCAYIIDRALRNLGKPQLYGTILNEDNAGQLYKVDDYNKMVERRKEFNFQPIEEYLKNRSITR